MIRLGRRGSTPVTRRSRSSPPLIGLVSDTDPPLAAAQIPCTSGWPSDNRCGGHGLAGPAPRQSPGRRSVVQSSSRRSLLGIGIDVFVVEPVTLVLVELKVPLLVTVED